MGIGVHTASIFFLILSPQPPYAIFFAIWSWNAQAQISYLPEDLSLLSHFNFSPQSLLSLEFKQPPRYPRQDTSKAAYLGADTSLRSCPHYDVAHVAYLRPKHNLAMKLARWAVPVSFGAVRTLNTVALHHVLVLPIFTIRSVPVTVIGDYLTVAIIP